MSDAMQRPTTFQPNVTFWLGLFISLHVILWTLAPFLVRYNLPMDSIEGAIWGQHLEWGYDKNPFLNGWLTALAVRLTGQSGFAIYLFSQLSVALGFWAIWKIGNKMLTPLYALVAVMLLEGIQYYNLHAIDFNDNTLELSLWSLTALFFYQALREAPWQNWILTGLFAALGMMAKYYTVVMLLPMALFLLCNADNRAKLHTLPPYAGLLTFLIIISPHFVWLFFHDFVTLHYAFARVSSEPTPINHIHFAALFSWQQLEVLLPTLLLFLTLFVGRKPLTQQPRYPLALFDKQFLLFVGLGPFLLTIFLSALTAMRLRAGWGEPLLSFSSLILLAYLQPRITAARFYRFVSILFLLLIILVTSYCVALTRAKAPSSANFPGKDIATRLTDEWHQRYHTPLIYVAGSRWMGGNVAFYSKDHPSVFINWDKTLSPWINEAALAEHGAIFIWDRQEDKEKMPAEVIPHYKQLGPLQIMHFTWLRNPSMHPVEVGVAFLPPRGSRVNNKQ